MLGSGPGAEHGGANMEEQGWRKAILTERGRGRERERGRERWKGREREGERERYCVRCCCVQPTCQRITELKTSSPCKAQYPTLCACFSNFYPFPFLEEYSRTRERRLVYK